MIYIFNLIVFIALMGVSNSNAQDSNWVNLFDGETTTGWHSYNSDQPIKWQVIDGVLFTPGGNKDIVTDNIYENFELEVEWKIEVQGNSGIFYHVQEDTKYPNMYVTGPEFQIIDDNNYPVNLLDKQKTGSCSDVIAPDKFKSNPPGNWNITLIKINEGNVQHWLNGHKILEFHMDSKDWREKIGISKFKNSDYAKVRRGKIGLQDHGEPVYFRRIRIKQ